MNFCITGMGRSGTKFLSTMLNKSKVYTVEHEPYNSEIPTGLVDLNQLYLIQNRFNSNKFYGEVNSFLRLIFLELKVEKKMIITRDPRDIYVSSFNKSYGRLKPHYFKRLKDTFIKLDNILDSGIKRIRFDKMISDPQYLTKIANYVNIYDVEFTINDCNTMINTSKHKLAKSFDKLSPLHQQIAMDNFGDYFDKYFIRNLPTNDL